MDEFNLMCLLLATSSTLYPPKSFIMYISRKNSWQVYFRGGVLGSVWNVIKRILGKIFDLFGFWLLVVFFFCVSRKQQIDEINFALHLVWHESWNKANLQHNLTVEGCSICLQILTSLSFLIHSISKVELFLEFSLSTGYSNCSKPAVFKLTRREADWKTEQILNTRSGILF